MIKLADFEMGSLFSIIQVDTFYKHESLKAKKLSCIWRGRKKEGGGGRDRERERYAKLLVLKIQEEDYKPTNASPQKLEKARK